MSVVYLIFNEGYTATSGADWLRPDLCHEGIRLARMLAVLEPDHPDTHGLQALLELQASRLPARTDAAGRPVLLEAQDRARWDQLLLRRGLTALERANAVARERGEPIGALTVQAHIAACHARARTAEETDWPRIAGCTTPSSPPRRDPSSRSTARSPTVARSARTPAWRCWTPCRPGPWPAPTCCPACAATCWPAPAGTARRRRRSPTRSTLTANEGERSVLAGRREESRRASR